MRGRRDLDKFVARFVHREQARILDLEEGAMRFGGLRSAPKRRPWEMCEAAKSSGRFAADREIFAIQASCPQLS